MANIGHFCALFDPIAMPPRTPAHRQRFCTLAAVAAALAVLLATG